ncbi:hypothetical protein GLOIN_2v1766278 [Rhizophagus irregularis DAOM 181602=DAOM 197198]|nr:hypothetical protein GLOIN_2v1766278 [Rhizophagus irregularis DAOM 181602=DAOM 197198]
MHTPSNIDKQQIPNASPYLDTINGAPSGDHTPDPVALIEAINNLFLETYESYTGKVRMTSSGDVERLVIHFHTAETRDLCISSTHSEFPDLIFHAHDPRQLQSNKDL